MYAVVQIGTKQYKIEKGDTIKTDRISEEAGKSVTIDKVVLLADKSDVKVGQPFVKGAKVKLKVVDHLQGDKVIAFKYRKRKDSWSKVGHRHQLTTLSVQDILV